MLLDLFYYVWAKELLIRRLSGQRWITLDVLDVSWFRLHILDKHWRYTLTALLIIFATSTFLQDKVCYIYCIYSCDVTGTTTINQWPLEWIIKNVCSASAFPKKKKNLNDINKWRGSISTRIKPVLWDNSTSITVIQTILWGRQKDLRQKSPIHQK